jgi:hypothetical protein
MWKSNTIRRTSFLIAGLSIFLLGRCQEGLVTSTSEITLYNNCIKVWSLLNSGRDHEGQKIIDSLFENYEQNFNDPLWGYLINYKAIINYHLGDYYLSGRFFQLAYKYAIHNKDDRLLEYTINNFAALLIEMNELGLAENIYTQDNVMLSEKLSEQISLSIRGNIAYINSKKENFEFVKNQYQKILKSINNRNKNDPAWIIINRNYGEILLNRGNFIESQFFLQKSKQFAIKLFGETHYQTSRCEMLLGDYFMKMNRLDSSLFYYSLAVKKLSNLDSLGTIDIPHPQFEMVYIESLRKLASLLQLTNKGSIKSFEISNLAITRINKLSHSITSETARFIIAEKGRISFDAGIASAISLYKETLENGYFAQALNWSIQAKSLSLYQLFEKEQIYHLLGIKDQWSGHLNYLRDKLHQMMGESLDFDSGVSMDTLIANLTDFERTENDIQLKYDTIGKVRDQNQVFPIAFMKSLKDAIYLGYHELDSTIVVFSMDRLEPHYFLIPKTPQLIHQLDLFRRIISTKPLSVYTSAEVKQFSELGFELFSQLVKPFIANFPGHHIIIQPDGCLLGIPFESLVRENTNFENFKYLPYLFNDYIIQYMSIPMLASNTVVSNNSDLYILCCKNSTGIPEATLELSELRSTIRKSTMCYFDSPYFDLGSLNLSGKRIHITSHSVINQPDPMKSGLSCSPKDSPWIQFSDILNLDLDGSHVFINGCQSGNGPINHGEGLISLGLAFALAGSNSVIQHLWTASDKSASYLSSQFYRNVRHKPVADALNIAKTKYLKMSSKGLDHPYYWSGMVCYSGYESSNKQKLSLVLITGLLLTGILIYLIFRKRNR